jgi:predicted DCC family thiol-disulfide oxidoreductase YuxK
LVAIKAELANFAPMKMVQPVLLFDGECKFCNNTVNFVIKRDAKARIRFAMLQSIVAQQLLAQYGLPTTDLKSFVFIDQGVAYTRSDAAIRVCRYFSGLWKTGYALLIIPPFIRNAIYDFIAVRRYKWFGRTSTCLVPTPLIQQRFLM